MRSLPPGGTPAIVALAFVALAFVALACGARASGIGVQHAWFRAMPAGLPDAGYFTIHNSTNRAILLTGASSSGCGMLMLHKSSTDNGMANMIEVASVSVAAGQTMNFAPGGYHLMCSDPTPELKPGRSIAVSLRFAESGAVNVLFSVRDARGR